MPGTSPVYFRLGARSGAPDSSDIRLPAIRHSACIGGWPRDILADSVELLTLKVDCIKQFFHWPRLIDLEFHRCPSLANWRPGVSFPSLERLSVQYMPRGQQDEVMEIGRRAPRLSALSLDLTDFDRFRSSCDCRFCHNGFEKFLCWAHVLW